MLSRVSWVPRKTKQSFCYISKCLGDLCERLQKESEKWMKEFEFKEGYTTCTVNTHIHTHAVALVFNVFEKHYNQIGVYTKKN